MRKENEKIQKAIKKVVNHIIEVEEYGWPPQCATFLYQPIRPRKRAEPDLAGTEKREA